MSGLSSLDSVLSTWKSDPDIQPNFVFSTSIPEVSPTYTGFPPNLSPALTQALAAFGITQLYSHQRAAWDLSSTGANIVITSGTASGKSLCYYLPILDHLLNHPDDKALLLFPTKALAQDQLNKIEAILHFIPGHRIRVATYDGDTSVLHRRSIRENVNILITNPDMLHLGMLPHHTQWAAFFSNLRFVVIDEIHIYRGVFGSHVANVLRRLNRVAASYNANPKYIMTSATIGNAAELASTLINQQVEVIVHDGAGHGRKLFCIYNPPVTNPALGIRKSALFEAMHLSSVLLREKLQSIIFGRTRRTVELILASFQQYFPELFLLVRGYRSGYLPADRRDIERGLRENTISAVVATSALELGVDIGALDASLIVGYPGTIASTTQQIGRAGRKFQDSLAILIATADPVDQFLARNPDYLLGLNPENALINPDHLLILINHLQCAAFELPLAKDDQFGNLPNKVLNDLLDILVAQEILHQSNGKYYWMQSTYPSVAFSLRNASADQVVLRRPAGDRQEIFGTVDKVSSYWMVHPGAIYLHEGQTYLVEELDLENNTASLHPVQEDFYTEPQESLEIEILSRQDEKSTLHYLLGNGELRVTSQVTGYKKVKNHTREILGLEKVDLPVFTFETSGMWLVLAENTVDHLRNAGFWLNDPNDYGPDWNITRSEVCERDGKVCRHCGLPENGKQHHVHHMVPFRLFDNSALANQPDNLITLCPHCHQQAEMLTYVRSGLTGLAYAMRHLLPLHLMCDTKDIEVHADPQSVIFDMQPAIIAFDAIPGGIGLSRLAYEKVEGLLPALHTFIIQCPCLDGCPSCIGPAGEGGYGGKQETLAILDLIKYG